MTYKPATLVLIFMLLLPAVYAQKLQQTYQLDTKKSKILWNTGKLMGGHNGYLLFNSGILQYSAAGEPLNGYFNMDMNSIRSTDNTEEIPRQGVDANVRKPDFFASDQYPAAVMNVKTITRIGSSVTYKVKGELTIKGITNPIEFTAIIDTKKDTAHITANVDIHRRLWNIHSKPPSNSLDLFSDMKEKLVPDIHVSLDLTLNK